LAFSGDERAKGREQIEKEKKKAEINE